MAWFPTRFAATQMPSPRMLGTKVYRRSCATVADSPVAVMGRLYRNSVHRPRSIPPGAEEVNQVERAEPAVAPLGDANDEDRQGESPDDHPGEPAEERGPLPSLLWPLRNLLTGSRTRSNSGRAQPEDRV